MGIETINWHTRAAHGCLAADESPWVQVWTAVYMLYAHSVSDTKAPLQLQYAACGTIKALYAYAFASML